MSTARELLNPPDGFIVFVHCSMRPRPGEPSVRNHLLRQNGNSMTRLSR